MGAAMEVVLMEVTSCACFSVSEMSSCQILPERDIEFFNFDISPTRYVEHKQYM